MPQRRDARRRFAPGPNAYDWLLEFGEVREWAAGYAPSTGRVYLRQLHLFLSESGLTPPALLAAPLGAVKAALVNAQAYAGSRLASALYLVAVLAWFLLFQYPLLALFPEA